MNRRITLLLKILLFLFALNSLSLFLYFTYHHSSSTKPPSSSSHSLSHTPFGRPFSETHQTHFSKPWPILPSYLPWSQTPTSVPLRSCEGYFGNGFTGRLDLLSSSGGAGWFRCWHSETLSSSICEGGRVRMVPERIQMAKGGEALTEVIGRREEEELPLFQNGAFEVDGGEGFGFGAREEKMVVDREFIDRYVPQGEVMRHTMRDLISKIRIVGGKDFDCDEVRGK